MSVSKQDIITAIKNSDIFLKIPELQGAKPRLNPNGSPFAFVGGFNMVFQLEHQNKKWAFRVWHVPMGEHADRYRKISRYLLEKKLSYFADFIYDEKGILVNGTLYDTIRMEWLEGKLLKEYIEENLNNKSKLTKLANDFLEMCKTLRENKISHGDLQEGNILIDRNGNIKLVDYDSICIPEIEGQKELVTGLKGYQHPSRFKCGIASLKADYFSELVIYLSIIALSENTNLWSEYQIKDTQYLLFTENDFDNFENSEIFSDLQKLSYSVKSLTRILCSYLSESDYLNFNPLEHYLTAPKINSLSTNKKEVLKGNYVELSWETENYDITYISSGIGNVTGKHSISVLPTNTTTYKLIAENAFDKTEKEISIEVLPLPKISEFKSLNQKLVFGKSTDLSWKVQNADKVELVADSERINVPLDGMKQVTPIRDTFYKLVVTALDGETKIEKEIQIRVYKKIEYKYFNTDFHQIPRGVEIELSWSVENAEKIILRSNDGLNETVQAIHSYKFFPTKSNTFWLEARNDLFNERSNSLRIEVDNAPQMTKIPSFFEENQIPLIDLKIPELQSIIIDETQLEFEKMIQPKRSFSISKMLDTILRK
ncbi:MAG: protein kinase family protein [Flavobacteriales bacterium]|nr:protein kinase family protein [Flavobacteriales bacterium]